ncbi:MAG TPA: hypothetical protein VLA61_05085 [Ideonella sp.]|uniref:hypothetical protein n=1 Tax=Ideonella sp. TaxID=1929293 RepID=UPI002BD30FF7|nr:hypothetical protein [Ideonella sp.]HSI47618.1 hypothetical protein [Ideonella sp.]
MLRFAYGAIIIALVFCASSAFAESPDCKSERGSAEVCFTSGEMRVDQGAGGWVSPIRPLTKIDLAKDKVPIGKGYPSPVRTYEGNLLYRHFDDTGNTYDIVEFDPVLRRSTVLVKGRNNPGIIAMNPEYMVLNGSGHPPSTPVEVIKRSTGQVVKQLRLGDPVYAGYIENKQLIVLQSISSYFEEKGLRFTRFQLPSLKVLGVVSISGNRLLSVGDEGLVALGYREGGPQLIFYNRSLEELGHINIPPPVMKLNASCEPAGFKREGDLAVISANCGEILVLNLGKFAVERVLPRYANFYSLALRNGLIYTTTDRQEGVVVFEAASGKELGRLPVSATNILLKQDVLLAMGQYVTGSNEWPVNLYKIDDQILRNGMWREQSVLSACMEAGKILDQTEDLYAASDLCRKSGIDALLEGQEAVSAKLRPLAIDYASWLTKTLHRYGDGLRWLSKLNAGPERANDVRDASFKKEFFERPKAIGIDSKQIQGEFSTAVSRGHARLPSLKFDLGKRTDGGDLYFFPRYVYQPIWGCYQKDEGVKLQVYERATFKFLKEIKIQPCDEMQQDTVLSVSEDEGNVYVRTTFRYEDKKRNNYFVVSKKDWVILYAKVFDSSLDKFPVIQGVNDGDLNEHQASVETNSFLVKQQYKGEGSGFLHSFYRKGTTQAAEPFVTFTVNEGGFSSPEIMPVPNSDRVIVVRGADGNGGRPFQYFDPIKSETKTFAVFPSPHGWMIDRSGFYVHDGSNIFVFDLVQFSLREVWPCTMRSNCDEDESRISDLYVNDGELIIRTEAGTSYLVPVGK